MEKGQNAAREDEGAAVGRSRFGWEDWDWDASLFEGSAGYYRRGRIPYAEDLVGSLARALDLDGHGRLLDAGCGPGIIALRLAHLLDAVIGLDPDANMLEEARRAAREQRIVNVSWVLRRAEDLPGGLGTFRLITFAQSFHALPVSFATASASTAFSNSKSTSDSDWSTSLTAAEQEGCTTES